MALGPTAQDDIGEHLVVAFAIFDEEFLDDTLCLDAAEHSKFNEACAQRADSERIQRLITVEQFLAFRYVISLHEAIVKAHAHQSIIG